MTSIQPILESTRPVSILDGRIVYYTSDQELPIDLINPECQISDILSNKNVLISEEALIKWLTMHNLSKVLNQYTIRGNKVLEIGSSSTDGYAIVHNGNVKAFVGCTLSFQSIISSIVSTISMIKEYNANIDRITEIKDKNYINLLARDHISDYISFDHIVDKSGSGFELESSSPISYDLSSSDEDPDQHLIYYDTEELWYDIYEIKPAYQRLIHTGDIVEISIGYRIQLPEPGTNELQYRRVVGTNPDNIYLNQDQASNQLIYEVDEPLHKLLLEDGSSITYNGHYMYYGRTKASTITTTIYVGDIIDETTNELSSYKVKLGNDLMLEITSDSVVVYSLTPRITEFIVKSCKLIKCDDN